MTMACSLISRRFVRIKALQNLYAYTIAQKAYRKEAIAQVTKDFTFNPFLDAPDQKVPLAQSQSVAIALCSAAVAESLPGQSFAYAAHNKIEQSVRKHLFYYGEALKEAQTLLQNGFNQSKASIYIGLVHVLLLLIE